MANYRVIRALSYPSKGDGPETGAAVGDVVDDIPEVSLPWLLEQGHITATIDPVTREAPAPQEGEATHGTEASAPAGDAAAPAPAAETPPPTAQAQES